jgi:hypothetical protein
MDRTEVAAGALSGGITLTDNHDGTATLSATPDAVSDSSIRFTASNPNQNTTLRKVAYTVTQDFVIVLEDEAMRDVSHVDRAFGGKIVGIPDCGPTTWERARRLTLHVIQKRG